MSILYIMTTVASPIIQNTSSQCVKVDFDTLDAMRSQSRKFNVLFNKMHIGYVTIEANDIVALINHQLIISKQLTNVTGNNLPDKTLTMSKHNNELIITYNIENKQQTGCVTLTEIDADMPVQLGGKTRRRRRTHKRKRSKKTRKTKSRK
jgi:hypothetical protein